MTVGVYVPMLQFSVIRMLTSPLAPRYFGGGGGGKMMAPAPPPPDRSAEQAAAREQSRKNAVAESKKRGRSTTVKAGSVITLARRQRMAKGRKGASNMLGLTEENAA